MTNNDWTRIEKDTAGSGRRTTDVDMCSSTKLRIQGTNERAASGMNTVTVPLPRHPLRRRRALHFWIISAASMAPPQPKMILNLWSSAYLHIQRQRHLHNESFAPTPHARTLCCPQLAAPIPHGDEYLLAAPRISAECLSLPKRQIGPIAVAAMLDKTMVTSASDGKPPSAIPCMFERSDRHLGTSSS